MLYLFAVLPFGLFSWLHRHERGTTAGFGWIVPVAMGAASLIGNVFKNKKANKQKQEEYDAAKAAEEAALPAKQAEAAAATRRNNIKSSLRWAIAKAYGLDKVMPELYGDRPGMEQAPTIENPFNKMKRPGGFSWGDFAGDAAGTVANTLASGVSSGAKGGSKFFSLGSALSGLGAKKNATGVPPTTTLRQEDE